MIRRVEQLLDGFLDDEKHRLIVMPDRVDEITEELRYHRIVFQAGTRDDRMIRGYVHSDEPRIQVETPEFEGSSVTILVNIDLSGLSPGDSVSGNLAFLTSIGERIIPVFLQAGEPAVESSYGELRDLDDFVSLAQRDPSQAFRLFTQPNFSGLLSGEDPKVRTLYRGLSANPATLQRMEEFLVASGKKEPAVYSVDTAEFHYDSLTDSVQDVLRIRKNTWSLSGLSVRTEGGFLTADARNLVDEDFVGSTCALEFVAHADRLRAGRHYGRIVLTSPDQTLSIAVSASKSPAVSNDVVRINRKNRAHLVSYARDFLDGTMNRAEYCEKTLTLLSAIRNLGTYPVGYLLYEAYVLCEAERAQDARLLLRSLQDHNFKEEPTEYKAAFLYLCGRCELIRPDQIDVVERIRAWHTREQESVILLGLRFFAEGDLNRAPARKMALMEELYGRGCTSPLLFAYASSMLREDPSLLLRLTPFTKQTLRWMVRRGRMTGELAERTAHLAGNEKQFSRLLAAVLMRSYDRYPSDEILSAVCRYLMKGGSGDPEYFRWYALGVEHDIQITRLYEYYIETMPEGYQKELPSAIRKYFAYSDTLSDAKKALIYANIVRNRLRDPDTYGLYREAMERFAKEMLPEGRMNENYAALYQHFLSDVPDRETGKQIADVLFTGRLYCDDPRAREVVVCHGELLKEEVFPLRNGTAYVPVYTKDAQIFFQDEQFRRYRAQISYSFEPLLDVDPIAEKCRALSVRTTGLLLYLCRRDGDAGTIDAGNIDVYLAAADSEEFTGEYRRSIRRKLLEYSALNAGNDSLDRYLARIDYVEYAKVNRKLLIEVLIARGFFDEAFDLLNRYGYEDVDTGLLVRLVSFLIGREDGEVSEKLLQLAAAVFRKGKYDERTLSCLVKQFRGPLFEMLAVRSAAKDFFLETYPLDERILLQAMFVRNYPEEADEILTDYQREGGRTEIVRACLIHRADGYFYDRCGMGPGYAGRIRTEIEENRPLGRICDLALLKYFSGQENLTEQETSVADTLMKSCIREGLRFGFYLDLPQALRQKYQLEDRVFVEQEADPSDTVTLYYRLTGVSSGDAYRSVPLNRMYRRIFSREFLLFTGETLNYYVEILHNGTLTRLGEKTIAMPAARMQGQSRYQLINQMRSAQRLGKEDMLRERIGTYCRADRIVRTLFEPEETQEGGMRSE